MSSLAQRTVRPSGTTLRLLAPAAAAIRDHALAGYPHEVVGILAGDRGTGTISEAAPLENRSPDRARDRYQVDGLELLKAERSLESRGLDIVGYYHSHPDHPAMYSDTDRDLALPHMAYLIAAVRGDSFAAPTLVETRCWRLREDRSEMLEDHLLTAVEEATP